MMRWIVFLGLLISFEDVFSISPCNTTQDELIPHRRFCDAFYSCAPETSKERLKEGQPEDGFRVLDRCEDGLFFSILRQRCMLPHFVECGKRNKLQRAKASGPCPRLNGLYPQDPDCSEFLYCKSGKPSIIFCRPTLMVSQITGRCRLPFLSPLTPGCFIEPLIEVLEIPALPPMIDQMLPGSRMKALHPFDVMPSSGLRGAEEVGLTELEPLQGNRIGNTQSLSEERMKKPSKAAQSKTKTSSKLSPHNSNSFTDEKMTLKEHDVDTLTTSRAQGKKMTTPSPSTTTPKFLDPFEIMGFDEVHDHDTFDESLFVELNDPNKHIVRRSIGALKEVENRVVHLDARETGTLEDGAEKHGLLSTVVDFFEWLFSFIHIFSSMDVGINETSIHDIPPASPTDLP